PYLFLISSLSLCVLCVLCVFVVLFLTFRAIESYPQSHQQQKTDHYYCCAITEIEIAKIVRVGIERNRLCRSARAAAGQNEDKIKDSESCNSSKQQRKRKSRPEQRQCDETKFLPTACPIQPYRLIEFFRYRLQACKHNDHHEWSRLPHVSDDYSCHSARRLSEPCYILLYDSSSHKEIVDHTESIIEDPAPGECHDRGRQSPWEHGER